MQYEYPGQASSAMAQGGARPGVSFTADFSSIGTARTADSRVLGPDVSGNMHIVDEEKRLIDKVFSIVDKDNSGAIDLNELEGMFKLFDVQSDFLRSSALQRIMTNVDKDSDGYISPAEFYKLLSQKFEKGDPKEEVFKVFGKMNESRTGKLNVDELFQVSRKLGENISKAEIKDMIKTLAPDGSDYRKKKNDWDRQKKEFDTRMKKEGREGVPFGVPEPEPEFLSRDDFYAIMQEDLQ